MVERVTINIDDLKPLFGGYYHKSKNNSAIPEFDKANVLSLLRALFPSLGDDNFRSNLDPVAKQNPKILKIRFEKTEDYDLFVEFLFEKCGLKLNQDDVFMKINDKTRSYIFNAIKNLSSENYQLITLGSNWYIVTNKPDVLMFEKLKDDGE